MKTLSLLARSRRARSATLFLLLLAIAVPGWARSYRIARYDATIHVDEDGSARVTEKISLAFSGEYHGITRIIPLDYPGPNGSNYSLFVRPVRVTDDSGNPLKYEKSTSGPYLKLKIFIPGAVDATRTVVIE